MPDNSTKSKPDALEMLREIRKSVRTEGALYEDLTDAISALEAERREHQATLEYSREYVRLFRAERAKSMTLEDEYASSTTLEILRANLPFLSWDDLHSIAHVVHVEMVERDVAEGNDPEADDRRQDDMLREAL